MSPGQGEDVQTHRTLQKHPMADNQVNLVKACCATDLTSPTRVDT